MSIKALWKDSMGLELGGPRRPFLMMLDMLMDICSNNPVSSQIVKAIRQALPGTRFSHAFRFSCNCSQGLLLLMPDRLMDVRPDNSVSSEIVMAIRQALPR